jgi:ribosome biogenesis GTPase
VNKAADATSRASDRPLSYWGWDDFFEESFGHLAATHDQPARVLRADMGACLVTFGADELHLPVHPGLRLGADQPTAGDFVVVREGQIHAVLERRTAVVRASANKDRAPQVLAANVEFVIVVEPLGERFRPRHLERLLVVAWQSGAIPIVVLTKADRAEDPDQAVATAQLLAPGISVHALSAVSGEGLVSLAGELAPGTTATILGRSGAGKSTLVNALIEGDRRLATGEVRNDGKGRHTTVTRELVRLANGSLMIDTPGIRAIGLTDSEEAIGEAFSDVESLAPGCRFRDCNHESEPGCAVKEAIEQNELAEERLTSYRRLLREQARLQAKTDPHVRAQRNAELRAFYKSLRDQPNR